MDKLSKCARFFKRKWIGFLKASTCWWLHRSRFPPPRSRSIWKPAWHFLIPWAPLATFAGCRRSPFPAVSPKRICRLDLDSWPAQATTSPRFRPRERSSNTPIGTDGTRRSTKFRSCSEVCRQGRSRAVRLKGFSNKGAAASELRRACFAVSSHVQPAKLRALLLPWAGSSVERRAAEPERHYAVAHS